MQLSSCKAIKGFYHITYNLSHDDAWSSVFAHIRAVILDVPGMCSLIHLEYKIGRFPSAVFSLSVTFRNTGSCTSSVTGTMSVVCLLNLCFMRTSFDVKDVTQQVFKYSSALGTLTPVHLLSQHYEYCLFACIFVYND